MELKIKKETAKKIYDKPELVIELLEEAFGKDCFKKRRFDDIKTFEDACEELGISTAMFSGVVAPDEIAYKKLKVVIKAINQGWIPDWDNTGQYKYYPYFNLSSGVGFSRSLYLCDYTYSPVGSRLCFESREKAEYAGQQFLDLYKQFLT